MGIFMIVPGCKMKIIRKRMNCVINALSIRNVLHKRKRNIVKCAKNTQRHTMLSILVNLKMILTFVEHVSIKLIVMKKANSNYRNSQFCHLRKHRNVAEKFQLGCTFRDA